MSKRYSRVVSLGTLCALISLMIYPSSGVYAGTIYYAAPAADGLEDCSSWENACILQTALSTASSGDEIWVKEGVHTPTTTTNRAASFVLVAGVQVYGGFSGSESSRAERDWLLNETILSGDIGTIGDNSDNSYHVVSSTWVTSTAVLDGFIITAGLANGLSSPQYIGGGMYNYSSSPTLTNVTFSGNSASFNGGGMYNSGSGPALTNVTFSGNSASLSGGGMYNYSSSPTLINMTFSGNSAYNGSGMYNNNNSSPTLINVTFSGNSATSGGGMYNTNNSSPTLTNVNFSGNSVNSYGGGMFNNNNSSPTLTNVIFSGNSASTGGGLFNYSSSPTLTNATFSGNSAYNGGGMYNDSSSPTLTNVTFNSNSANYYGGGMYNNNNSSPTLTNVILWGNTAGTAGNQIYNSSSNPTISYSLIQGCGGSSAWISACGTDGGGNIDADPLFVDPDGVDNTPGTLDDNLRLQLTSPAIDAGDNGAVPAGITTDLDGSPRISNDTVDMGAYEAPPARIYVDRDAPGSNNGSSWEHAFTNLQAALNWAIDGVEVWVAEGIYKPTTGTDRTATFQLKSGVEVYGGFSGSETNHEQRNQGANPTVLSGDIDNNDLNPDGNYIAEATSDIMGDNSYHVVSSTGVTSTAILDGFIITAGTADGSSPQDAGGGMYNSSSSPTLTNVTFSGNSAYYAGGGMYNTTSSSPTLTNVTFSGNYAYHGGGGMFNGSSSPVLTNVTFSGNTANHFGGGMYNTNYNNPTLTNVTFSGNSTDNYGGGMYNTNTSSPTLTNVILWGNTADAAGNQIYNGSSNPTISYSLIQDCGGSGNWDTSLGSDEGGNLDANPLFVDPDGVDNTLGTLDDNLRLQLISPAIDAGNNAAVPVGITTDLGGNPRFVDIPSIFDWGSGTPPIVDMGAYEVQVVVLPLILR